MIILFHLFRLKDIVCFSYNDSKVGYENIYIHYLHVYNIREIQSISHIYSYPK